MSPAVKLLILIIIIKTPSGLFHERYDPCYNIEGGQSGHGTLEPITLGKGAAHNIGIYVITALVH